MSHTNSTANYSLSQFISTDTPGWMSDVNQDNTKIDTALHNNAEDIATNTASIGTINTKLTNMLPDSGAVGTVLTKTNGGAAFAPIPIDAAITPGSSNAVSSGAVSTALNGVGGIDERVTAVENLETPSIDNGWICKRFNNGYFEAFRRVDVAWGSGTAYLNGYYHLTNDITLPSFTDEVQSIVATSNSATLFTVCGRSISGNNMKLYIHNSASGGDHAYVGIHIVGTY